MVLDEARSGDGMTGSGAFRKFLLLYLLIAVLFPSYQGYEDGQEFHFFSLVESPGICLSAHPDGTLSIEASLDGEHPHEVLYFHPARKTRSSSPHAGGAKVPFVPPLKTSIETSRHYTHILTFSYESPSAITEKKASGLSPPI
jgi:hypothetical protein